MKKQRISAYIGIIFVNVMWGLSFIASKYSMQNGLTPFSLAMVRYIVTPIVLLPPLLHAKFKPYLPKKDIFLMAVSGLFGATIYFYFENNGILRTTAANASLIVASIPVFTMLSGVIFHKKRPSKLSWLGAVLSLTGVYLVVSSDTSGTDSLTGNLLMLCACICWVVYVETTDILLKRGHSSLEITWWQSVFSLISLLPLGLTQGVQWSAIPLSAYLASAGFLGCICSALCFFLYAYSIQHLSPIGSAIFLNLNPLAAVLGSVFLLGETILPIQILGGAIIIGSIFLVNRPAKKISRS